MRLNRVTITGADESVRPVDLCRLYDEFPFVEWGILLSASKEGREQRYPSRKWIDSLLRSSHPSLPLAGHLCGQWCRDAVAGPFLWAIERPRHFLRFQRLQFNGAEKTEEVIDRLARYGRHLKGQTFILQCRDFGRPYACSEHEPARLLDRSGGRGVELKDFPDPDPVAYCGYAGGLGPKNLEAALTTLTNMPSDRPFWVDMESGVRSGADVFDLKKVRRCLQIAKQFIAK